MSKKLQILGSFGPEVDATLTQEGKAADAKVAGEALSALETKVGDTSVSEQISAAENEIKLYTNDTISTHNTDADVHSNMGWLTSEDEIADSPTLFDADTLNGYDAAHFDDQIAVERARINTFVALEDGSTTGDAELQDIRVGYDGAVYETAGEAVRGQIQLLSDEIDKYTPLESANLFDSSTIIEGVQFTQKMNEPKIWEISSISSPIPIVGYAHQYVTITFSKPIGVFAWYDNNGERQGQVSIEAFTQLEDGGYSYTLMGYSDPYYIAFEWGIDPIYTYGMSDINDLMVTMDVGEVSSGAKEYLPYGFDAPAYKGKQLLLYDDISDTFDMPEYRQQDTSFFIGKNSGINNPANLDGDDGKYNCGVGVSAMENNITGDHNVGVGYRALYNNVSGDGNTAIGEDALHDNTTGGGNVAVGSHALQNQQQASGNTAIGESALLYNENGYFNTAVGNLAGIMGGKIINDARITLVGAWTDKKIGTGTIENSTAIGCGAEVDKSNQVVIGNNDVQEVVLGGKRINFNADGTVTWESI